jgi:hypothetical protein
MKTYIQYPPRKLQSEAYSGPITLSQYERFQHIWEMLGKEGINIPMPTETEALAAATANAGGRGRRKAPSKGRRK